MTYYDAAGTTTTPAPLQSIDLPPAAIAGILVGAIVFVILLICLAQLCLLMSAASLPHDMQPNQLLDSKDGQNPGCVCCLAINTCIIKSCCPSIDLGKVNAFRAKDLPTEQIVVTRAAFGNNNNTMNRSTDARDDDYAYRSLLATQL